jgi:hypothetical protein
VSIDAVFPAGRREGHDAEEIQQYVISRDYMIHWRM